MRHGVEWYRTFGTEKSPGMRIFCLSGNEISRPLRTAARHAAERPAQQSTAAARRATEHPFKAIVPGGLSMKMLTADQLDAAGL